MAEGQQSLISRMERAPCKLLVLSDLHLEFSDFDLPAELSAGLSPRPYDAVVLAGDILSPGRQVPDWARDTFGEVPM
jgi:predicted MPP superfamily phosphohydrolase